MKVEGLDDRIGDDCSVPLQPCVYKRTLWDQYMLDKVRQNIPKVEEAELLGQQKSPEFSKFVGEMFGKLFSYDELEKVDPVQPEHAWMESAHNSAQQTTEYEALRQQSRGDADWAAIGASALSMEIAKVIEPASEDVSEMEATRNAIKGLESLLEDLKESGAGQEAVDEATGNLGALRGQYDKLLGSSLAQLGSADPALVRQAVRVSAFAAIKEIERTESAIAAYGWGDGTGVASKGADSGSKQAVARKLRESPKLVQLAEIAGRMRQVAAKKQETKVDYARSQVASVVKGGDLERLLPSETVKLCDEDLEGSFYGDLMDGNLLQYELTGKEKKAKGPIICCIDNSGSMEGERELVSKGISLGLLQIANMQGRSFVALHFDTEVKRELAVDTKTKSTAQTSSELLSFMDYFSNGSGTSFVPVLDRAVELIRAGGGMKEADVVIVTDDEWTPDKGFVERYRASSEELGFATYAVSVSESRGEMALKKLGAEVYRVDDLVNASDVAGEVFSKL